MTHAEAKSLYIDFEKCVDVGFGDGVVDYACKLGLWSVSGCAGDLLDVKLEAVGYFSQYRKDGECHRIIGGKNPMEVMLAKV